MLLHTKETKDVVIKYRVENVNEITFAIIHCDRHIEVLGLV